MATFTISLSEDRLKRLKEMAERFRVAPEDLVRVSLEELLTRPGDDFSAALERTLRKNADLYRKLA